METLKYKQFYIGQDEERSAWWWISSLYWPADHTTFKRWGF